MQDFLKLQEQIEKTKSELTRAVQSFETEVQEVLSNSKKNLTEQTKNVHRDLKKGLVIPVVERENKNRKLLQILIAIMLGQMMITGVLTYRLITLMN